MSVASIANIPETNVSQNSIVGNIPSGMPGGVGPNTVAGGPPQSTPASSAVCAEVGATKESFNVNVKELEKVTKLDKSQKTYQLGSLSTTFVNPTVTNPITPVSFGQTVAGFNQNPLLSFMRGEYAQNVPLYNDAIAVDNGFLGYSLNVIV